jgi:hypothetical protein
LNGGFVRVRSQPRSESPERASAVFCGATNDSFLKDRRSAVSPGRAGEASAARSARQNGTVARFYVMRQMHRNRIALRTGGRVSAGAVLPPTLFFHRYRSECHDPRVDRTAQVVTDPRHPPPLHLNNNLRQARKVTGMNLSIGNDECANWGHPQCAHCPFHMQFVPLIGVHDARRFPDTDVFTRTGERHIPLGIPPRAFSIPRSRIDPNPSKAKGTALT